LEDEYTLSRMREAAKGLAKPDAASELARELFRLAGATLPAQDRSDA
jgi:hypothetical protein